MSQRSISQQFLNRLKDKANIVDVIGESVLLKKSGNNYMGLCPFHGERSPSFSVSENKQLYHCFGCKVGGDLIAFVQNMHGLSFVEAVEDLAERSGLEVPQELGGKDAESRARMAESQKRSKAAFKLNRFVASYYRSELDRNAEASKYLQDRQVDAVVGRNFYLGFAPPGWDSLTHRLETAKAPLKTASELGLVRPSKRSGGSGYFDLFRDRLMFPIVDLRGRIRAFGGRRMHDWDPTVGKDGQKPPKYLNSPESFIYQKSNTLFGLYQAQKHIREEARVIVCEGFFDAIALHRAGITHAVATCGTALTTEHLKMLERFKAEIVVLFDGDSAGQEATQRAMELGLKQGHTVRSLILPQGLDPDDYIKENPAEALTEKLKGAPVALDAMIEALAGASLRDPQAKTDNLKKIGGWLSIMSDVVGRELRVETVGRAFQVSDSTVRAALSYGSPPKGRESSQNRSSRTPEVRGGDPRRPMVSDSHGSSRTAGGESGASVKVARNERILLYALLNWSKYSQLWMKTRAKLPPKASIAHLFRHHALKKLTTKLLDNPALFEEVIERPELCLREVEEGQVRSMIAELAVEEKGPEQIQIRTAMERQVTALWARISQQLKRQLALAEASGDASIQEKLLKDYLDVQRKIKEFNNLYGSQKEVIQVDTSEVPQVNEG